MKVKIEINAEFSFTKPESFRKKVIKICKLALNERQINHNTLISLLFCGNEKMAEINNQFRSKNYATNVLSFENGEIFDDILILGDIAVAIPVIIQEAKEQEKTFEEHLLHMITHGVLHLLGFDHEKPEDAVIMESIEDKILLQL